MYYVFASLIASFIAIVVALYAAWKESQITFKNNNPFYGLTTVGEFLEFCFVALIPVVNVIFIAMGIWHIIKPNLEFLSKPMFKGKED